jgi:predicted RNA-binding Zn-ribbon protein involved in translation (DUF1610 family)
MRWFLGRSARDREHLVQTLRSLGPTSLAGLSAALSWSERRTERVLQDALARGDSALRFDPARRTVAWQSAASPMPVDVSGAAPGITTAALEAPPLTPVPVLPKSWGASAKCPSCQVAYLPTGTDAHLYCPQCGRLAATRSAGSARPADPSPAPVRVEAAKGASPSMSLGPDRRSQELFAAWVTAQPIACPKCRTPLRHHGVAEYACPACGARVAFERSAGVPTPTSSTIRAAAPAPSPPPAAVAPPAP